MSSTYSPNFLFEPPPAPSSDGSIPFGPDDFASRIIQLLPQAWFNDAAKAPGGNLWAIVSGFATSDADIYTRIGALGRSLRLNSAETLEDLAVIAKDFFGASLPPLDGESPDAYRNRIGLRLFLPGGTRDALRVALTRLLGQAPVIVEPWNPGDCGAWDGPLGWDGPGLWGDLDLPWQGFVQTKRPSSSIAADGPVIGAWDGLAGWDQSFLGFNDALRSQITPDSVVYDAINAVKPEGVTVWVQLS
ncbi:hypothetical protein J7643_03775 [bacterium]|nr:hypothetical protein [bacterium]